MRPPNPAEHNPSARPPAPPHAGGNLDPAASLAHVTQSPNDLLAAPHDLPSPSRQAGALRPERLRQAAVAEEHAGPLAVDHSGLAKPEHTLPETGTPETPTPQAGTPDTAVEQQAKEPDAPIASAGQASTRPAENNEPADPPGVPPRQATDQTFSTGATPAVAQETAEQPPRPADAGGQGPTEPPTIPPPEASGTPEEPTNRYLQEFTEFLSHARETNASVVAEIEQRTGGIEAAAAAYLRQNPPRVAADIPEYLEAVYKVQTNLIARMCDDPVTAYTHIAASKDSVKPPIRLPRAELGVTWGKATQDRYFQKADDVIDSSVKLISIHGVKDDTSMNQVARATDTLLQATYDLVKLQDSLHARPFNATEFANRWKAPGIRIPLQRGMTDFARTHDAPPRTTEIFNNDLPRFMWHAHNIADATTAAGDTLPPEYHTRLRELWAESDGRHFVTPEQITHGDAPFHTALRAAEAVAKDGYPDAAYAIKSQAYANVLQMEARNLHLEHPELPFMHYIFVGSVTGQVPQHKGAFFDYAADCSTFMSETWGQLSKESREGVAGPATAFMQEMHVIYSEASHTPYLARSLVRQAELNPSIDIAAILHGLAAQNVESTQDLIDYVRAQPRRPVFTNIEAQELAARTLEQDEVTVHGADATQSTLRALGEETDIFGFKTDVSTVGNTTVVVSGDVDLGTRIAYATVEYRSPGSTLTQPVTINLATGEVSTSSIEGTPLDPETANRYRGAVETALTKEATAVVERQAAEAAEEERRQSSTGLQRANQTDQGQHTERQEPKIKTQGEADPDMAAAETDTPEVSGETTGRSRVIVENATPSSVASLINDQKITGIDPQRVLDRINGKLTQTREGGAAFGKPTHLADTVKGGDQIKLRQINWIVDRRQIRLYFQVKSGGRMELCGVYDKRGANHQQAYLQKLTKQLIIQDKRETGQAKGSQTDGDSGQVDRQAGKQQRGGKGSKGGGKRR